MPIGIFAEIDCCSYYVLNREKLLWQRTFTFATERPIDIGPALDGAGLAKLVEETLAVTPDVVAMVKKARGDMQLPHRVLGASSLPFAVWDRYSVHLSRKRFRYKTSIMF